MKKNNSTEPNKRKVITTGVAVAVLLSIFGMAVSLVSTAQPTDHTPGNFYAVTGKGIRDTSWVFGTYHLVKSSYLDEVPAVVRAFKQSAGVVVELVIDSTKLAAAAESGLLKGQTLTGLLDQAFTDTLEKEVQTTLGVGVAQINQLKPINVAITLSMVYIMTDKNSLLNKYSGQMIDGYFAAVGKQQGKQVTSLETLEEQMDLLFNNTTNEEQVNQLKLFLRNKEDMVRQGNELVENWFRHDLEKMYAVSLKGLDIFGGGDELLKKRNDKWMAILPGLMEKKSQFIAVGALHLAGPDGILQQLQQSGYTITPVKL